MEPGAGPRFSAAELISLFEQVPAIVWACDLDMKMTFAGGAPLRELGVHSQDVYGVQLREYFGTSPDAPRVIGYVRRALAGEKVIYELQWQGAVYESHASPMQDEHGRITGVLGIALDVTQRRRMEDELFISRYSLQQTTALFPLAHFTMDGEGTLHFTGALGEMLGLPSETQSLAYKDLLKTIHPDDRQSVVDARRLAVAKHEPYSFESRFIRPDGSIRYLRFHISYLYDRQGSVTKTIGTAADVSDEIERMHETIELLRRDGITGLPNRTYFTERLRHDLAFAEGTNELMALVLLDLDRFSRINDSLGYMAGDAYLRSIAGRLRSFSEGTPDTAARIGGDEFAVLLRGCQRRGDLVRRIESLRTLLEEAVTIEGHQLHVGVSMGVGIFPQDADDQSLMLKADLALSRARSTGMGRTEYYDLMLARDVASSFRLEHGLHSAIKESQLLPYYQPIVDADSRIQGIEALARWNHPEYGLLAPKAFLDVAEESGLIVELGESLLLRACSDAMEFRKRAPELRLNVNLSSRHLLSPQMVTLIAGALAETGLPAYALQIEVTEQSLIEDVNAGQRSIESLRVLGASVVIDDFGTGYNTLSYLKSYHVDGIKLDRYFVRDMLSDRYSRAICEGVMAMARSLNLHVIAEGIESTDQRTAAIELGCEELQGFLFGKPMPTREFEAVLSAR
jgi:diguanylate cyclase (GGDEF)-like protein/PAS domain S-box-containing protein